MAIAKKIDEVRELIDSLHEDLAEILAVARVSVPIGEQVVKKAMTRLDQIKKIFSHQEKEQGGESHDGE